MQAGMEVDAMKTDLTAAKAVVVAATQECNALLGVIASSTTEVEAKQEAAIHQEYALKVPFTIMLCCQSQSCL